ncbi:hypothetical protein M0813_27177 [Anaeramoeba flamelloides]|uniref:BZIP domain-containing protein n=1 Tax=Anaeramoeba flamelloides TaxID=1746091 RepID=A0ABQ8Y1P6_9EUKA|nr:hypothetical protein M0813_27177 [Anaeramoeba flamelloides]
MDRNFETKDKTRKRIFDSIDEDFSKPILPRDYNLENQNTIFNTDNFSEDNLIQNPNNLIVSQDSTEILKQLISIQSQQIENKNININVKVNGNLNEEKKEKETEKMVVKGQEQEKEKMNGNKTKEQNNRNKGMKKDQPKKTTILKNNNVQKKTSQSEVKGKRKTARKRRRRNKRATFKTALRDKLDEMELERLENNKIAAREFRKREKEKIETLKTRVEQLEKMNQQYRGSVSFLIEKRNKMTRDLEQIQRGILSGITMSVPSMASFFSGNRSERGRGRGRERGRGERRENGNSNDSSKSNDNPNSNLK